jgi:hypothetical protein
MDAEPVGQKGAQSGPHHVQVGAEVHGGHVVALRQAVGQRPSHGDVPLADVGTHHQYADATARATDLGRGAIRPRCR